VNPTLAGVALAVVLGAVVATSARNARAAVLGLVLALVGASFVADPLPDSLGLGARLIGTVLAGYLLWVASRGGDARTGGSRLGWPAELLVAGAAAAAGYGSHISSDLGDGPAVALATGFALVALAVGPIINGRDALRTGIGLLLLIGGAILVRSGLAGHPAALEQLVIACLVAALGGAVATLAASARLEGETGFELATATGEPVRRPPVARSLEPR